MKRRDPGEVSAVELVEQAVHLLRGCEATEWAIYLVGSVPFVVALLFFWARTTWFSPAGESVAGGAFLVALLFVGMKAAQAEFCARLMARRMGRLPAPWAWSRFGDLALTQLSLQPWALLAVTVSALLTVPFGWTYAYAQSLTVIGRDDRLHDAAAKQAQLWPAQNHLGLALIFGLAFALWLNLLATFFVLPWLANRLLGIDNLFGMSGWAVFNSTLIAGVTLVTWLLVDPVIKAFYVLRVFHGRARRTGDDIRSEFLGAHSVTRAVLVAALLACVGAGLARPALAAAAEGPAGSTPVPTSASFVPREDLDRSIDEVLQRSEFEWRLRPRRAAAESAPKGPFAQWMASVGRVVREMFATVGRWIRDFIEWLNRGHGSRPRSSGGLNGAAVVTVLMYGILVVITLLLLWLVISMIREARRRTTTVVTAEAVTAAGAVPDLRDHDVHAAQLPVEGWLQLARTEAGRGAWRLALRALYLATLAQLAAEGVLSLAKFKTNLDYERELRRRALARPEAVTQFSARRETFESVWYGSEAAEERAVRQWLAELEGRTS